MSVAARTPRLGVKCKELMGGIRGSGNGGFVKRKSGDDFELPILGTHSAVRSPVKTSSKLSGILILQIALIKPLSYFRRQIPEKP
jgi:hypothetical protein